MNENNPTALVAVDGANQPDYLSAPEVAAELGVAKNAVYRWMRERRLAHHRFGRRVRVHRQDLRAFVSTSRREAEPSSNRYGCHPPA
jgi:excisionase family DNA binding protein